MTRLVAVVPAMIVAVTKGDQGVNDLLVLSQVVLSFQLPFAVWPLIYFTSRGDLMNKIVDGTAGSSPPKNRGMFVNSNGMMAAAFTCGAIVTGLNGFLVVQFFLPT